ncbi:4'-phosphopantetheinyl transferase family protein [Streptomyces sp. NPDC001450]
MIESILPADVRAVQTFTHRLDIPLSPQEEAVIAGAGPKRRAEFTSVRACAHDALTALGVPPAPLLPDERGAPNWPSGVVGSMTHCTGTAPRPWPTPATSPPSASTPSPTPRSLTELRASSPAPRSAPPSPGCLRPGPAGTTSCAVPRSPFHKAWYPVTRRWLNFQEASLGLAPDGTSTARLLVPAPPELACLHGRWAAEGDHVVTAVVVEAG